MAGQDEGEEWTENVSEVTESLYLIVDYRCIFSFMPG